MDIVNSIYLHLYINLFPTFRCIAHSMMDVHPAMESSCLGVHGPNGMRVP